MKIIYMLLLGFFSITTFGGCYDTSNDTAKENIEKVLTTQFTSVDEELISLWEDNLVITQDGMNNSIPDVTSKHALGTYLSNTYEQYFDESALDSFISKDGLLYQTTAALSDYQMSVGSVSLAETNSKHRSYQITVVVNYQKANEPLNSATVTGFVSVNKQGKITRINIIDDGNLYTTFITSQ